MVTYINPNNSIDTIYELFISLTIFLFAIIFLCKVGNFLSSLPVKEVKKKSSKSEKIKEVKKENKETVKVVDSATNNSANSSVNTSANVSNTPIIIQQVPNDNYQNNYLYDRFVERPTKEDYVKENKISQAFMSEKEFDSVRNNDIKIRVKDNEFQSEKNKLYNRISQMTSSNLETRERLLKEFEGLSKEMKLLLIDNIIQKM